MCCVCFPRSLLHVAEPAFLDLAACEKWWNNSSSHFACMCSFWFTFHSLYVNLCVSPFQFSPLSHWQWVSKQLCSTQLPSVVKPQHFQRALWTKRKKKARKKVVFLFFYFWKSKLYKKLSTYLLYENQRSLYCVQNSLCLYIILKSFLWSFTFKVRQSWWASCCADMLRYEIRSFTWQVISIISASVQEKDLNKYVKL